MPNITTYYAITYSNISMELQKHRFLIRQQRMEKVNSKNY